MTKYKSARSKACDITREVKIKVQERDSGRCIFCGQPGIPNAHFIPRSQGGLGIEQNVLTLCVSCHHEMDNGKNSNTYKCAARRYLEALYPNFTDKERVYVKHYNSATTENEEEPLSDRKRKRSSSNHSE